MLMCQIVTLTSLTTLTRTTSGNISSSMSQQEYEEFLRAIDRVRAERANTREQAREFLKEEGLLTESGELAPPYEPAA